MKAIDTQSRGLVESISDGICAISGLKDVAIDSIVEFPSGINGLVVGYDERVTDVIILGDYTEIKKGDYAKISKTSIEIPVGACLLGRVVDPLGNPIDGKGLIRASGVSGIESKAKGVFEREGINKQLNTGIALIDSQIPIGRGQRELFIGEKKIGKEDAAVSAMVNQSINKSGVYVVYVAIASQTSFVKRTVEKLAKTGADKNTIFMVAMSSDSAPHNYLAPMSGMSMAESLAAEGKDVLIILDNLTRHARIYRQISLLLKRAPGREAYPGDIFYLHSRLLERSGKFSKSVGGGSITAIPLVEVASEDVTDYITTNLMSITDGHILFTRALYHAGRRPAINSSFSVSRLGGKAQNKVIREFSNQFKQKIGGYTEMESLISLGSEVQESTKEVIARGKRIFEFLNQDREDNIPDIKLGIILYFMASDFIMRWPYEAMNKIREQFVKFISDERRTKSLEEIYANDNLDEAKERYNSICEEFVNDSGTIKEIEVDESPSVKETMKDVLKEMDQSNV
jgi:F-type H+-transporting ATPase subunit alpha